jgi:hypothetical protein
MASAVLDTFSGSVFVELAQMSAFRGSHNGTTPPRTCGGEPLCSGELKDLRLAHL